MTRVTTSEPRATASREVYDKAQNLYATGQVRRVASYPFSRIYRVGSYTVMQHRENIDADRCDCAWNRYQPFNTAVCSHVLAARMDATMPLAWWRKVLLRVAERMGR